jgi:glycosyltransferase involved in cell wall biosynthesis
LKVALVGLEYFHWGVFGGFGMFTRKLAVELVKRGVTVEVLVSKLSSEQTFGLSEIVDGVKVTTAPRVRSKLFSDVYHFDADVVHEQYNPMDAYLAFRANHGAVKVVTVQDLRTYQERQNIFGLTGDMSIHFGFPSGWHKTYQNFLLNLEAKNIRSASAVICQAHLLEPKVRGMFGFKGELLFYPNFIDVPARVFNKSARPSVLWLARLDPVKNPLLAYKVAECCPEVDFYILGKATTAAMAELVERYRHIPNLHFMGHIDGEAKEALLCSCWFLINTSFYECLPVSFLEGLAHKCCLVSTQNPDGYTERFGFYDDSYSVERLAAGLRSLIVSGDWQAKGKLGYEYVKAFHSTEVCVNQHLELYRRLLS